MSQALTSEQVQSVLLSVAGTDVSLTALPLRTTWTDWAFSRPANTAEGRYPLINQDDLTARLRCMCAWPCSIVSARLAVLKRCRWLLRHRSIWGGGHAACKSICATEPCQFVPHSTRLTPHHTRYMPQNTTDFCYRFCIDKSRPKNLYEVECSSFSNPKCQVLPFLTLLLLCRLLRMFCFTLI